MFSQAEKRLWNAVLLVAAQDARSAKASLRAETRAWITTKDFETVCEWAGQSSEGIKQAIERILVQKLGDGIQDTKRSARNQTTARGMSLHIETEELA